MIEFIVCFGVVYVFDGCGIFVELSVDENLWLGVYMWCDKV